MKARIWGGRGSLPAPMTPQQLETRVRDVLEQYAAADLSIGASSREKIDAFLRTLPTSQLGGYGGNTPCFEVSSGDTRLVVDAGSGLRLLGYDFLKGPLGKGQGEAHLLFTHFHWDHLIGLPFFVPIFIPGNTIHAYAVQPDLPQMFEVLFRKPYFPVELKNLGAKIQCHTLAPRKPVQFGDISVTPYQLDHPDPCWGYRFECAGRSLAYCVDTECTRVSREELGLDLPLYQNLNAMVFDAQYTLVEAIEKVNWGHAAANLGLDIAMREGIERVYFIHHDPASSDARIAQAEEQARRYYRGQVKAHEKTQHPYHAVEWHFAREGTEFTV